MKDYSTDNEVLYMIEETNEDAVASLIEKYSDLINICVKKYNAYLYKIGIEEKDLYQEGLLGLLEASNRFDKNKQVQFKTYATTCIESRIITFLKTATRKKHMYLNDSLSLDNVREDEKSLYEFTSKTEMTPEEKIMYNSEIKEVYEKIKELLTDFELNVFILNIKGYKNKEIAEMLSKNVKSIENTLQRVKVKLAKIKKDL